MKSLLALMVAIVAITPSCKKNTGTTSYMNTATIKGQSMFTTACGGTYWIVIDGVPARTTFNSLPAGSGIDLDTVTFPVKVKLNWHYTTPNNCYIIAIDAIERTD